VAWRWDEMSTLQKNQNEGISLYVNLRYMGVKFAHKKLNGSNNLSNKHTTLKYETPYKMVRGKG
jgi:hypothetical protein